MLREPRRAGRGLAATSKVKPPEMGTRLPDPTIAHDARSAAKPYAVPLRSTAPAPAAEVLIVRGSKLDADKGSFSMPIDTHGQGTQPSPPFSLGTRKQGLLG